MLMYLILESNIQYGLSDFISKAAVIWSFVTVKSSNCHFTTTGLAGELTMLLDYLVGLTS